MTNLGHLTVELRDLRDELIRNWDELLFSIANQTTACLPDFFFDILLSPTKNFTDFFKDIQEIHNRKGGVYKQATQNFSPGGNAGNLAVVLGALGVQTTLLTKTSLFGRQLIEHFLGDYGVKFSITETGVLPSTIALELKEGNDVSNIMINSNLETLSNFGSDQLDESQWKILSQVDLIAITNFCANDLYLDLVVAIADRFQTENSIFLDFSDISHRTDRIKEIYDILDQHSKQISHISLNENEIAYLDYKHPKNVDPFLVGQSLSCRYPEITFCVHTESLSSEICNGTMVKAPSLPITPIRMTGAGDTWNAGYIAAKTVKPRLRLFFGNCCAAFRVVQGDIPSMTKIKTFIQSFV